MPGRWRRRRSGCCVPVDGALEAGQVVLFRLNGHGRAKHCGILVGPDRFIHAQERLGVVEANLTEGWARRVSGRFGFPEWNDILEVCSLPGAELRVLPVFARGGCALACTASGGPGPLPRGERDGREGAMHLGKLTRAHASQSRAGPNFQT